MLRVRPALLPSVHPRRRQPHQALRHMRPAPPLVLMSHKPLDKPVRSCPLGEGRNPPTHHQHPARPPTRITHFFHPTRPDPQPLSTMAQPSQEHADVLTPDNNPIVSTVNTATSTAQVSPSPTARPVPVIGRPSTQSPLHPTPRPSNATHVHQFSISHRHQHSARLVPDIGQTPIHQAQTTLSSYPDTQQAHPTHISYSYQHSARLAPVIGPRNQQLHTDIPLATHAHSPMLPEVSYPHSARPVPVIGHTVPSMGPHPRVPSVTTTHQTPLRPFPGPPRPPGGPTAPTLIALHSAATPPHSTPPSRSDPAVVRPPHQTAPKNKKKTPKPAPSVPPPPPPLLEEVSPEEISHFLDTYMDHNRFQPLRTAQLRVGFLNIDSLYGPTKLPYVFWLMDRANIDIVILVDVRSTDASVPFLLSHARRTLGPGSIAKSSYGPPGHEESVRRRKRLTHNARVGGQIMLCNPHWGRFCTTTWADPSGLGLVLGAEFTPSLDTRTLIIGVYIPVPPIRSTSIKESSSLWKLWIQWARQHGVRGTPLEWVKAYTATKITNFRGRHPNGTVICGGDFNATVGQAPGGVHGRLDRWMSECHLTSAVHEQGLRHVHTRWAGTTPTGHIDHIMYDKDCVSSRMINAQVLEETLWTDLSDHRWVLAGFQYTQAIPPRPLPRPPPAPLVDVDTADKRRVAKYQEILTSKTNDQPDPDPAQRLLDICMASRQAAQAVFGKRNAQHQFFNCWSPQLITLKAQAYCLLEIHRCLTGDHDHPQWTLAQISPGIRCEVSRWEQVANGLLWPEPGAKHQCLDNIPECSPTALRLLPPSASFDLADKMMTWYKLVIKKMQGRARSNYRKLLGANSRRIEHFRSIGKLKRVIPRIMAQDKTPFTFDSLILPGDTILTDPLAVHNRVAEHFDAWFTGPPQALTGIHDPDTDWTTILTDETTFRTHCRTRQVPEDLTDIIWRAVQTPQALPQIDDASNQISDALQAGVSWEEFRQHVTHMDTGTAPGWTGFTHAMMRSWPEPLMREVHTILQRFGPTDAPEWWSYRLMSPIQKVQGSTSLDSLRPIMLLEVIRKVWTTLLHRKIAHAWETFGLLATGQAGGRPRRGTESPIMQLIAYLDHRRQSQQATFITFWDITKAFDSPSKNVLRASLARLAVPPQWAEWFVAMDMRGGVLPKSPSTQEFLSNGHRPWDAPSFDQATDQPGRFRTQRGCSQGDPPAPRTGSPFSTSSCERWKLEARKQLSYLAVSASHRPSVMELSWTT